MSNHYLVGILHIDSTVFAKQILERRKEVLFSTCGQVEGGEKAFQLCHSVQFFSDQWVKVHKIMLLWILWNKVLLMPHHFLLNIFSRSRELRIPHLALAAAHLAKAMAHNYFVSCSNKLTACKRAFAWAKLLGFLLPIFFTPFLLHQLKRHPAGGTRNSDGSSRNWSVLLFSLFPFAFKSFFKSTRIFFFKLAISGEGRNLP